MQDVDEIVLLLPAKGIHPCQHDDRNYPVQCDDPVELFLDKGIECHDLKDRILEREKHYSENHELTLASDQFVDLVLGIELFEFDVFFLRFAHHLVFDSSE
jgi:hypothetical protein